MTVIVEDVSDSSLRKLGYNELREGQRKVFEACISRKDVLFALQRYQAKIASFVFSAVRVENAEKHTTTSIAECKKGVGRQHP